MLGRLWGRIVASHASFDACVRTGLPRADDRLVVLEDRAKRMWHLVDVRGCGPFEWANGVRDDADANLRVTPGGYVHAASDVAKGDELVWHYGSSFAGIV